MKIPIFETIIALGVMIPFLLVLWTLSASLIWMVVGGLF